MLPVSPPAHILANRQQQQWGYTNRKYLVLSCSFVLFFRFISLCTTNAFPLTIPFLVAHYTNARLMWKCAISFFTHIRIHKCRNECFIACWYRWRSWCGRTREGAEETLSKNDQTEILRKVRTMPTNDISRVALFECHYSTERVSNSEHSRWNVVAAHSGLSWASKTPPKFLITSMCTNNLLVCISFHLFLLPTLNR